jgi:hypothetical protein
MTAPPLPPVPSDARFSILEIPPFTRALWIFGATGAGKSTLARQLKEAGHADQILETGHFVRAMHGPEATVQELTATTLDCLDNDPRFFAKKIELWLEDDLPLDDTVLVVGARNPVDVAASFDPHHDAAVMLMGTEPANGFERYGLAAIRALFDFWGETGVIVPEQHRFLLRRA